jgi:hypothetical protein
MKNAIIMLAVGLTLTGCTSQEEKLCRAAIESTLLNPETAEISGFTPVDGEFEPVTDGEAKYFRFKVRAEGSLGNKITKMKCCVTDESLDNCICVSPGAA